MRSLTPEMENYLKKGIRTELQRMYRVVGFILGGIFVVLGLFFLILDDNEPAIVMFIIAFIFFIFYIELLGNFRVRKRRKTHKEILMNGIEVRYKLLRVGQNPKKKEQESRRPQLVFQLDVNKELVEIRTHRFDFELLMITQPEGRAIHFPSKYPEIIIPTKIINYHSNRNEFHNAVNFPQVQKFNF